MQNTPVHHAVGKAARRLAAFVGAVGFILSLAVSGLMLYLQGNPGFLIIWLFAVIAMATFTRLHYRWQQAFKRLSVVHTPEPSWAMRSPWQEKAEDVPFRDMPNKCQACN